MFDNFNNFEQELKENKKYKGIKQKWDKFMEQPVNKSTETVPTLMKPTL